MNSLTQRRTLSSFYENLTQVQRDLGYYLNPIGLARRNAIIAFLQAQPNDVIGDLGCGEGLIAMRLRGSNRQIIGCDLSLSRARLATANGIEAVAADVLQLPYPDALFDKIICTEVIEHVLSPAAALREIFRVLRDGGIAILTVPLNERLERTLLDIPETILANSCYREIKDQFHLKNSHLSSFTEDSLQELALDCGFHVRDTTFTYDYVLKRPLVFRIVRRLCYTVAQSSSASLLARFVEALAHPLIFASHQKQNTKHHIVLKVKKCRP